MGKPKQRKQKKQQKRRKQKKRQASKGFSTNFEHLLLNTNSQQNPSLWSTEKYKKLADYYVPRDLLLQAAKFSLDTESHIIPPELKEKFPTNYPREIIELYWNEDTKNWLSEFVKSLQSNQKLTDRQRRNALSNIQKAIALRVMDFYPDDDFSEEDFEEIKSDEDNDTGVVDAFYDLEEDHLEEVEYDPELFSYACPYCYKPPVEWDAEHQLYRCDDCGLIKSCFI